MSGRVGVTWCAPLATLCGASALLPLAASARWAVAAVVVCATVTGVGALSRRVPLARPLTVVLQAVVGLHLLTQLFAARQAAWGFLAGPGALEELGRLLRSGFADVARYATPAPVTPGIHLLLVGGVLVVGLMVDALALTYGVAAAAGLPLLALYSVGTGLTRDRLDWLWFLLAAGGFLLLLVAEGRERRSRWGRVLGGPPTRAATPRAPRAGTHALRALLLGPAGRVGHRAGALALGLALLVPMVLPALGDGVLGPRYGGPGDGSLIAAVNPLVSLQGDLNQPEDREVLAYRTSADDLGSMYLRIVSLDEFDGTTWKPSSRPVTDVPSSLPAPPGLAPGVRTTKVTTSLSAADWYAQNWLPMPYPASRVRVGGQWRFEPVGRTLVGAHGQNTRGARYTVTSLMVRPTARQLADAPPPPADLLKEYTAVPPSLPRVVHRTALRVTRGATTSYDRAVALQDWFDSEGGFTYNTQVSAGTGVDAIARFLKDKQGFCVHFAFTMAAMARTLGIPARVAVGFAPGTPEADGTVSVGLRDAHAWPELYFQGVGWTRFEPTPSRGTVPEYTAPDLPTSGVTAGSDPAPGHQHAPAAPHDPASTCSATGQGTGCASAASGEEHGEPAGSGGLPAPVLWSVAAACAALLLLLPALIRLRTRAHRLRHGRDPDDLSLWWELLDSAWDLGIRPDPSRTPRDTAGLLVRVGGLSDSAGEPDAAGQAVYRLSKAAERTLYGPEARPSPRAEADLAEADLAEACAALRNASPPSRRLRARLLPASTRRVWWAFVAHGSGLLVRLRAAARATRSRLARDRT